MEHKKNNKAEDILSTANQLKDGLIVSDEQEKLAHSIKEVILSSGVEKLDPGKKNEIWQTILLRLRPALPQQKRSPKIRFIRWAAAASLLLFTSIGIIYFLRRQAPLSSSVIVKQDKNNVLPGSNKAVLTLANGAHIVLDNAGKGLLTRQGGTTISKTANGQILYKQETHKNDLAEYNMITTPRGGQYEVILPDGTKAWLNAASSLRFPTAFIGKERSVELTGEAYFEVVKNKSMPFKVSANGVEVKVLGTHFNVMAYSDEKEVKTTLLEGSVKLSKGSQQVLLSPGQQGTAGEYQTAFNIKEVDVENEIAWHNGLFVFDNENIQTIMKQISRWYDVDVVFHKDAAIQNFGGTVSRFKDVSEVLKALELTGLVHFKIEGRRIMVMQ